MNETKMKIPLALALCLPTAIIGPEKVWSSGSRTLKPGPSAADRQKEAAK